MSSPEKLWNRNFLLLWCGQTVSGLGSVVYGIAMMFWIKDRTEDPSLLGLLMMSSALPGVFLGPFAGTIVDMYSRKRIIILSDLINGLSMLTLTAIYFFNPQATGLLLTWIFFIAVLAGINMAFFNPAIRAAVPDLVPAHNLTQAVSVQQFTIQGVQLFGLVLGGIAFQWLGALKVFFFNGLSYIISAITEVFMEIPQDIPEKKKGLKGLLQQFTNETGYAFRYVWQNHGIRALFLGFAFINFFIVPVTVMMPFYIEDVLAQDARWYGFIMGSLMVGGVIGTIFTGAVKFSGSSRRALMLLALPAVSGAVILMGSYPARYPVMGFCLMLGFFSAIFSVNITAILQATTESGVRGRVFGLLGTLSSGLVPVAMGLTGFVTEALGNDVPLLYRTCGIILILLSILLGFNGPYRAFLATDISKGKIKEGEIVEPATSGKTLPNGEETGDTEQKEGDRVVASHSLSQPEPDGRTR